jgi:phosphatidylglycerophosphate synthase
LSLVCLFLRQYFDYVDGIFARNFNQTSKFGDYYDHFSDIFIFYIPFIIILLISKRPLLYTSIALSAGIINSIQLGCVEREYNQNNKMKVLVYS